MAKALSEEEKHKAEQERIKEEIRQKRAKDPLDAELSLIKVGDKIKFCSDCYKKNDLENHNKYHGEVLEISKFEHTPEKSTDDSYSGKGGTFWFLKVKDIIGKETFTTLAELVEKA